MILSFGVSKIYISTANQNSLDDKSLKEKNTFASLKENKKEEKDSVKTPIEKVENDISSDIPIEPMAIEENQEITKQEVIIESQEVKREPISIVPEPNPSSNISPDTSIVSNPSIDILDTIKQNGESLGTLGRLFLPSVDFSVAVYSTDLSNGDAAQKIVDNKDSAAYFQIRNKFVIADHNHQGFHRITNIEVGEKAYIKNSNGQIEVYKMVNKLEGMNLGYDLTDLDEKSVLDGQGDLILYTCYKTLEYDNHVMITIWELEH